MHSSIACVWWWTVGTSDCVGVWYQGDGQWHIQRCMGQEVAGLGFAEHLQKIMIHLWELGHSSNPGAVNKLDVTVSCGRCRH